MGNKTSMRMNEEQRSPFKQVSVKSGSVGAKQAVVIPTDETLQSLQIYPKHREKVGLEDFTMIRTIGKGSFGKVILVRKISSGEYFAMKILLKKDIIAGEQVQHTITEKNVLQDLTHPYAFHTEVKLYLVLDFAAGGDLFYHLKREERFNEERCRLYAAEITLAFEALHERNIIYRDLKPENVLLGKDGHAYLTDFGLCKPNITNQHFTNTFCGTPEYLAPEMLHTGGYGKAVDWWALGTFLYEILIGIPPFYSKNTNEMYSQILHKMLTFPDYVSEAARDLLTRLLVREPRYRLGGDGSNDAADVKIHPFFAKLNWDDVYNKRMVPQFIPDLKSDEDLKYIDPEFLNEPIFDEEDLKQRKANKTKSKSKEKNNQKEIDLTGGKMRQMPPITPFPLKQTVESTMFTSSSLQSYGSQDLGISSNSQTTSTIQPTQSINNNNNINSNSIQQQIKNQDSSRDKERKKHEHGHHSHKHHHHRHKSRKGDWKENQRSGRHRSSQSSSDSMSGDSHSEGEFAGFSYTSPDAAEVALIQEQGKNAISLYITESMKDMIYSEDQNTNANTNTNSNTNANNLVKDPVKATPPNPPPIESNWVKISIQSTEKKISKPQPPPSELYLPETVQMDE
ncbi:MAG: putative RAC family serine/threonine-protein kinase [Streblomastix strix]|uniref:Putative RAC family serine/threonine-protein kinase n=1 Tax=Streblomastix strix TaxID=222440 RepID=A0A5J4WQX9_9EUKA|nr:MAG: putative RAC family serine/threonine-protein kinase [Streblomastix strix]